MGTMQLDDDLKRELDDSGCVQDEPYPSKKSTENGTNQSVHLLDLSDDVLLYILRHCSPRDLKALGFSCSRLARLVLERSLWRKVDARGQPSGRARLRWLVAHALHVDTTSLYLAGYAREAAGCLGYSSSDKPEEKDSGVPVDQVQLAGSSYSIPVEPEPPSPPIDYLPCNRRRLRRNHTRFHISAHQLPRYSGSPSWPEEVEEEDEEVMAEDSYPSPNNGVCSGPRFTVSASLLLQMSSKCPYMTTLALEYCNINCKTTAVSQFPSTLRVLSLRGSKCFNLPVDKSFLFMIQDCLPDLESVDLSECEWLEPSSLLPLSKLRALRRLRACDCCRLSEFVAYASLAARYGFRELRELELRGSPVGDSEVSALGWLPALRELRLAAAPSPSPAAAAAADTHRHGGARSSPCSAALDGWELQEPEYFRNKLQTDMELGETQRSDSDNTNGIPQTSHSASEEAQNGKEAGVANTDNGMDEGQTGSKTTKRRAEDGSGDSADVNGADPSSSKRKRLDDEENGGNGSDSDSSGDDSPRKRFQRDGVYISITKQRGSYSVQFEAGDVRRAAGEAPARGESSSSGERAQSGGAGESGSPGKSAQEGGPRDDGAGASHCAHGDSQRRGQSVRGFVCFRRNREPTLLDVMESQRQLVIQAEPSKRVLYLNFGLPGQMGHGSPGPVEFVSDGADAFGPTAPRPDPSTLVSDSSVRRFGRAEGEDISYIHIGPGAMLDRGEVSSRPDRSGLRTLSMVGYRHITDRSLVHLATAAPELRLVDFRGTSVTAEGVANFRSLRPDCEVRFGPVAGDE